MKNSKTFLLLSVIVAVLVLGVVYAALSADLTITANATVAPDGSNFTIAFTDSEVVSITTLGEDAKTANASLVTLGQSGTAATLTIAEGALKKVGDTVVVSYTVTNSSTDLYANLGEISITEEVKNDYVKFSAVYGEPSATKLEPKTGDNTVVVTAQLVKSPSDASVVASAKINFQATSSEN